MNPIELEVKESYASVARSMLQGNNTGCCSTTTNDDSCCAPAETSNSRSSESLGCDIRLIDVANPQQNEVVIDLGSGPGFDTRKVAPMVKPGKVFGIDFGEDMIKLANSKKADHTNIEYLLGKITDVPLEDDTADLIISNCVFNLVPDKAQVFREVYRLLKPGGRVVVSDMIANTENKQVTSNDMCACIGGATSIENYLEFMRNAGLTKLEYHPEYESTFKGELEEIAYQSVLFIGYK